MKKSLLSAGVVACLALGSHHAFAAKGFEYSYAEAGYQNIDGDSLSADAFYAGFSFGATDLIHVDGSYTRLLIDDVAGASNADLDGNEFKIGIGGHYSVTKTIDVLATLRYVDLQITGTTAGSSTVPVTLKTNVNEDDEGAELEVGARLKFGKEWEVAPSVIYQEMGGEDDTGFGVKVLYRLDRTFSLGAGATYFSDDDETGLFAGLRINL